MLCMSDVILINLLTVLIFIYDFVKIIFIEQAGLPTFFPQGKKTNVDEDTLKGLLSTCSFCLKFYLTFYGDWHGIAGMADLASLILSLCFLHPLMLTLPLLKMLVYFYWGRETLFFPPSFVVHIGLPKGWPRPLFFSYSAFLRELVSLTTGLEDIWGTHPELHL